MFKLLAIFSAKLTLTLLAIGLPYAAWPQKAYTVLETKRPIDPSRYDEIKGSPYLYKEWQKAEVVGADGKILKDVYVNYNGLTHQLEMKENGEVSEMDAASYLKVMVATANGNASFFRGIHPQFGAKLICLPYDGQRLKLIKDFNVSKQDLQIQSPMGPEVHERFVATTHYFLMIDGQIFPIKLKKKKIIGVLGNKTAIEKYLEQENLNLNNEGDLVRLLVYYEADLHHN